MKKIAIFFTLLTIINALYSCGGGKDAAGEQIEPDVYKRARKAADAGGSIFGDVGKGTGKKETTFDFATSNVLWRATLQTLNFIPLANADYSGGIILTDWYGELNSKEQIKLNIRFLSNEVRSDSIQVLSFKKICDNQNNCSVKKIDDNFSNEIKSSILNAARLIKIEDQKKVKN